MFKNSEDEKRFKGILRAYCQEFGAKSLILHLPRVMVDSISSQDLPEVTLKFWNRNSYSITVQQFSANFLLEPED